MGCLFAVPTSPVTLPAPFFFTGSIVQVPCSLFHFATFFSVPMVSFPVPGPFCQILSTLFISCWLNRPALGYPEPHHRLLGIGSVLEARRRRVRIAGRGLERERILVWLWCSCSALLVLSSCHLLPRILLSKALGYCDWCRLTIGEPSCCIPGHFGQGRFFSCLKENACQGDTHIPILIRIIFVHMFCSSCWHHAKLVRGNASQKTQTCQKGEPGGEKQ